VIQLYSTKLMNKRIEVQKNFAMAAKSAASRENFASSL
jgi:hypothetical protein